jgi:ankyrin repeat protein
MIDYLAAHGCDINEPCKDGLTPLLGAIFFGNADAIRHLVSIGANINYISQFNPVHNAVMFCAFRNRPDLLKLVF